MDEALRREVGFLATRLGAMVREQSGQKVFGAIESLRLLSKRIRESGAPDAAPRSIRSGLPAPRSIRSRLPAPASPDSVLRGLSPAQASAVAHAFSLFFHLVNLCEERQRVRRLRDYEQKPGGAPISLRHTFNELNRHRVPPSRLSRFLASVHIEPVLTAHPTEAKRRSVINHILRIGRTLDALDGELGPAAVRAVDPWVEALWLTDEVRQSSVTPRVEIENTLVYLERTIYDLAGTFWEQFCDELARFAPATRPPAPFLHFGSWVGTDRDGNPNVTPETSLDAAEQLRQSVLGYYRDACERLLAIISLPGPRPALERRIRRDLARDLRRFPATRAFEQVDQPNEYYRRKLRVMKWRIERTAERAAGGSPEHTLRVAGAYRGPEEFARDARLLERLLAEHPSPRLARLGPGRLHVAAQVFGFHGATLDFREHSSVTRAAVDALLGAAGLPREPASERIASIRRLLRRRRLGRTPAAAAKALEEFRTLARIQSKGGEAASHRFILSMTARAADLWDLLLLARHAGLVAAGARGRLTSSIDVIPLFETFDDLDACADILDQLLSDRFYRRILRSRGDFQEVMLGYSDSVKDSGYMAANWALFRAQERLAGVARKHGVRLGLFHGKGGTIDRGGGLSYRTVQAQPYSAPGGSLRITEQGEVISLKYSNPTIAQRNLEQLVTSVLDAHLLHPKRALDSPQQEEWAGHAAELAATSRRFYNELVYETPGFPSYFFQATPIDLIEQLRLGSRPSRRFRTGDLRAMRAIPWVFAWTQSRHFLPSWYGLGHSLESFVNAHPPDGMNRLMAMYNGWPFFAVLIENAEVSLAKTDLYIARRYAALVRPPRLGGEIFGRIEQEFERSRRFVLEISGHKELLERQPVLAESIRLRNPYVDPLNFLQLRFLARWRRSRRPQPELLHLLQITVGGIAFGMKSTG